MQINSRNQHNSTPWSQVREGDKIRICIDPRDLNKVVCEHYPTTAAEEVASQIGNATKFTNLAARHTYLRIKLDEKSLKLSTINNVFDRYSFLRPPFWMMQIRRYAMSDGKYHRSNWRRKSHSR